jgi:polyphenol oxidase
VKRQFELKTVGRWSYYCLPHLEEIGIVHGFMTKSSDSIITDERQRQEFMNMFSATAVIVMQQQHGEKVHPIENGERPLVGDGLLLMEKGAIGVIKTADCLPVILFDSERPMAAIVHAGWRGTARKITEKALQRMLALGAKRDGIEAIIGPGIGPCCYEVGAEVVAEFRKADFEEDVFTKRGVSVFLDLKKANRELIEGKGIREIHDVNLCTACRQDLFFSARRDVHAGRQVNFVQIKR